jgi:hypothetical protein
VPTKFELVMKTTRKALGIDVPMSLMVRADEMQWKVGLWHL